MSLEDSLCSQSTVYVLGVLIYVPRGQFMLPKYSLCPWSTSLCPYRILFMSLVDSLCSQSTVYVLGVLFMSIEYYLCPLWIVYVTRVDFMFLEDSLCTQSRVYALTVQFMSPNSTV